MNIVEENVTEVPRPLQSRTAILEPAESGTTNIEIVLVCPYWIRRIYVIRQRVIIESFLWFATYNQCRNRERIAAKRCPAPSHNGVRNLVTKAEEVIHEIAERNGVHR